MQAPDRVRHAVLVEWLALWLIVRRDHRGRRCERTSGTCNRSQKHETLHLQLEFFLGVFEESKGIDSRQSADLSSKTSVKCLDTESLGQPTALVSTTFDRSMCNEFLEHLFLYYWRPEEAPKQENACLYSHPHGHSSFFNLKALCILILVRQKDRQVREHPCYSHTKITTNKKVSLRWSADAKRSHDARANKNKRKKSTNRNSTSEVFEFDSEPVGAQIIDIAAADQRVAVDFLSITAQLWRKQTKPVLPWND